MTTAAADTVTDRVLTNDLDATRPATGGHPRTIAPTDPRDPFLSGSEGPAKTRTSGRYPAVIWLLLVGNLLVRSAGFAYPFMAYHVAGRGYAPDAVGVVLAAYGVGWATGQLLCGWLVDRIGAKTTLVSAMFGAAGVLALMAQARSAPELLAGATIAGLVSDAPRPVLGAAIANLITDPGQRAKLDAWRYGWVLNIGAAVTGGVGGVIADLLGTPVLYWINSIACAAFAVMAARGIPAAVRGQASTAATPKISYLQAFSDKRLLLLFASGLATLTALMGFFSALPMLMNVSGLGAGAFGWVQLGNALAVIAITPLLMPWLSRRLANGPRLDILAVAAVWVTLCMGAAGLAHTTIGFGVAATAVAPGEIVWFVVGTGIVHRIASPTNSGRYHGIWSTTVAAASVVAPILSSYSLIHGGRAMVAGTVLTVGFLGAALCLPLARVLVCADEIPFDSEERASDAYG